MESASPAVSILFPVTGNGGSRSEANWQLYHALAAHHLQYGFRVVNFVICPTLKEALEAPIEEWRKEFAEFAAWSWAIKDSVGTMGLWRGCLWQGQVVDRPTSAGVAVAAFAVSAVAVTVPIFAPLTVAAVAVAGAAARLFSWISRRDPPWRFWRRQSRRRMKLCHAIPLPPKEIWSYFWKCFETIRKALSTRTIGHLCLRLCSRNGYMEFAQREHLHLIWCRRILSRYAMLRNHPRKNTTQLLHVSTRLLASRVSLVWLPSTTLPWQVQCLCKDVEN